MCGGLWRDSSLGILHCVQDDGNGKGKGKGNGKGNGNGNRRSPAGMHQKATADPLRG
jgi:hypothetical protein